MTFAGTPTATEYAGMGFATTDPAPTAEVTVDEDDWHVLGSADAAVTIVEYSDFQ